MGQNVGVEDAHVILVRSMFGDVETPQIIDFEGPLRGLERESLCPL